MKPTFKHYLSIAFAMLAIFLSGYGIGFLLGERKGQQPQTPPEESHRSHDAGKFDWASWERTTIRVVETAIGDLNPEQIQAVRREVAETSARIRAARQAGRTEFLKLNERLKQHLTPEQQAKLPGTSPD